jgi:hypothetical protein
LSVAEFETNLRRERQLEGIAKAKAAGGPPAVNRGIRALRQAACGRRTSPRRSRSGARRFIGCKRTLIGRRTVALAATFRARLGEAAADPVLLAAIDKAARLVALAESVQARALRADPKISLDDVVRVERLADIAVRRLRLDRHAKPAAPSLADYLRERS